MDPSLTLRNVTEDEWVAYGRAMARVFLEPVKDEEIERWRPACPTDRFLVVTDERGEIVATSGSHPLRISMPGADPVRVAGVTAVTVRPDHRRRGVLRSLMQRLLEDAAGVGEPWAALYASEGEIYGRFGFGPAAPATSFEIRREALATVDGDVGSVVLLDAEEAKKELPGTVEDHARQRGGMVLRDDAFWDLWLDHHVEQDPEGEFKARWHAVVPGRGYAVFRAKDGEWARRRPDGILKVQELVANDAEAAAALWAFLASVDLVEVVRAGHRPVDDPLPFLVANEAAVDATPSSPLWVRPVDLPAALTSRAYEVADRVVLEVRDEQLPANDGTWALEVGPGGATCTRVDEAPDVQLPVMTLSTLVLGGYPATQLADAGRLAGASAETIRRLDRLFAVPRAPWTPFVF